MAFPETKINPTIYQIIRMVFDQTLRLIKVGNPFSTITKTQINVTTASTLLLASNTSRKYAGGFNQSGGVIYVNFGDAAVVGEGVRVTNNNPIEVPKDFTGAIYAIRNIGAGNIEMFEGT